MQKGVLDRRLIADTEPGRHNTDIRSLGLRMKRFLWNPTVRVYVINSVSTNTTRLRCPESAQCRTRAEVVQHTWSDSSHVFPVTRVFAVFHSLDQKGECCLL